jgi:hypothetical protein
METLFNNQDTVAHDAYRMKCSTFMEKYDDKLEILDADNLLDLNEGNVNLIYHDDEEGERAILFYEGELVVIE